jgi:6,7-dimethyl-8-ribityllumazine synthase
MARYALVVARFYEDLAERLEAGARRVFEADGGEVDVFDVPGAYELGQAALHVARTGRYRGIACLGAVIRGETDHYDHVCEAASRGVQEAGMASGVPVGFGVLTVDTREQALARSGGGKRDTGAGAAEAVLALAEIRERAAR